MTRRPTFAKQLRKVRIKAKVSQSELGRMTGISRTVINRYEAGRSTPEFWKKLGERRKGVMR